MEIRKSYAPPGNPREQPSQLLVAPTILGHPCPADALGLSSLPPSCGLIPVTTRSSITGDLCLWLFSSKDSICIGLRTDQFLYVLLFTYILYLYLYLIRPHRNGGLDGPETYSRTKCNWPKKKKNPQKINEMITGNIFAILTNRSVPCQSSSEIED